MYFENKFCLKMYKFILVIAVCFIHINADVPGVEWVPRAQLINTVGYISEVMQELIYEVERRGFSTLRMIDVNKDIDMLIANWQVNGTVLYTNGFVKSIQKIDVSTVDSVFTRTIENEERVVPVAVASGRLHFRDVIIGYDVIADITNVGVQRYTGEILNTNVDFNFRIEKNVLTEVITVLSSVNNVAGGISHRMSYRPENHITQVLSRGFSPFDIRDGVSTWTTIFNPIVEDIVRNKIAFPRYCFNNCT